VRNDCNSIIAIRIFIILHDDLKHSLGISCHVISWSSWLVKIVLITQVQRSKALSKKLLIIDLELTSSTTSFLSDVVDSVCVCLYIYIYIWYFTNELHLDPSTNVDAPLNISSTMSTETLTIISFLFCVLFFW